MRSKLYISLVVAALICSAAWTGYAQKTRQGWEYKVDPIPDAGTDRGNSARANERFLNERAAEGWELAAIGANNFYFKRAR